MKNCKNYLLGVKKLFTVSKFGFKISLEVAILNAPCSPKDFDKAFIAYAFTESLPVTEIK